MTEPQPTGDKGLQVFPFDKNEHGVWCPNCGNCIRSVHDNFDPYDDPDPPLQSECRECGFPEVSEEWIEANV